MARYPRRLIIDDGATFHITWQCHNKSFLLEHDWAKDLYYQLLLKHKEKYGIKIYSYCFMSSHPHLTGKCRTQKELSRFMQVINTRFAMAVNKFYKRTGQAIRDRFVSPQIQNESQLHKVMTYIDLNPVRAKIVTHPRNYHFCSYHYYAFGKPDPLIDPCPSYEEFGSTPDERQRCYRQMVETILDDESGLKRMTYSQTCFIGDPSWVKKRFEAITMHQQRLRTTRNTALSP